MIIGIVVLLVILVGIGWIAKKVENLPSNRPSTVPLVRHHGAGNADGQTAQQNDESSQGDHQAEGSSGSIFWPLVIIVLLLLAFGLVHYNWSHLKSRFSADDMTAGPTECAELSLVEPRHSTLTEFVAHQVTQEKAPGPMGYDSPPCGSMVLKIKWEPQWIRGQKTWAPALHCFGPRDEVPDGTIIEFQYFRSTRNGSFRRINSSGRFSWHYKQGAGNFPFGSIPWGTDGILAWVVGGNQITLLAGRDACS